MFVVYGNNFNVPPTATQIIGLCERFLTGQTDSLLDIPGYRSNFLHRKEARRGGLAIYTRNEYAVHINNQLSRNVEGIFKSLFLELYGPFKKLNKKN